jgi:hypothetical protein
LTDYHRILVVASWPLITPLRPRDFAVESKLSAELSGYWLAKCAVLTAENNASAAREARTAGNALRKEHPSDGMYEFDRDFCGLLDDLLDRPSCTQSDITTTSAQVTKPTTNGFTRY